MTKSVLIVDDAAFMRLMQKNMLEEAGYYIIGEAENGIESVSRYKLLRPDIVLMNLTMPEMDGIEATKEILNFDRNAKIIMCSAMGQAGTVLSCIRAGALHFIVQPFEHGSLSEGLDAAYAGERNFDFKKINLLLQYESIVCMGIKNISLPQQKINELIKLCKSNVLKK